MKYMLLLCNSLIRLTTILLGMTYLIPINATAQGFLMKKWDYRFGGANWDEITSLQPTFDGGIILYGFSRSNIGGDKTQMLQGLDDFWIVKTDSLGLKQWDKDFGGTGIDDLYALKQTIDGGYILGGASLSPSGGDKTQPSQGASDYWIVKIDSLGNKLWDKDFGGSDVDELYSIQETSDGGYILGGYSYSGMGGDKSQPSQGDMDYWIIKIDSLGNKQWDKDFGGTGPDVLYSLQQTYDKGYILSGGSNSGVGGDKTEPSRGIWDYWIIKIDSAGVKQWDKTFGSGLNDNYPQVLLMNDGYLIAGISQGGIGGDKTQPTWGGWDFWVIKIDSSGNMVWDKDYGGSDNEDGFGNVSFTSDHGLLIAGSSYSPISGDKTENDLGAEQGWVFKTDSLGIKQWDKTIFTTDHDEISYARQTNDGCYVIANYTTAGPGGYKTQSSQGNYDYWILKLCDSIPHPLALFTSPNHLCPGACTDFINLSQYATSYQWTFQGANPSSSIDAQPSGICYNIPGNYSIQLIATNQTGSDTLTLNNYITVYPYPAPQGIAQNGDTLFANPGAGSYQWYYGGVLISGATNYFYLAPQSGDYNVVASDVNGCEVEAAIFNVIANILPLDFDSQLTAYPSPGSQKLMISNSEILNGDISIYNLIGEKVLVVQKNKELKTKETALDISQLPSGIYIIEMDNGSQSFRGKFLKQ
jgi:hypothetical protein